MNNILFISNDPSVFDPQSITRERMRTYAKEIGALHIISHAPKKSYEREDLYGGGTLFLHGVRSSKPFSFLAMKKLAQQLIREQGIEVVSAQDPFEYGWVAMSAVQGTSAKLHIQIHTDFLSPWFTRNKMLYSAQVHMPFVNRVRQYLADQVLPKAHGIRAVSERVRNSITMKYGSRVPLPSMIPIAVPSEIPPPALLPPRAFTFALIAVGRLEPEKRVEDILAAIAQIHDRYPAVGLVVVGDGSERKRLQKLTHRLGLASKVLFLGNRTDALALMQSAQAFIQASGYEGYSRTLVEAALARLPIITTDVGIVGEVFRGYEDVLAAPPGDPAALAIHIVGLVEDNQAREEFSLNAEKAARAHLASVHTTPADIAADLRSVLGK
jgi:glycosyltransferase involved in cell wall biosynthesis